MARSGKFYDLLFEVSNEYRHSILLLLLNKPMRVKDISKELDLTSQEISRHVSRLGEVGLTFKDVEGFHHLSNLGELVMRQLEELEFTSLHSDYLSTHSLERLPREFLKRVGDLSDSAYVHNVMDFLHHVENIINEAEYRIYFLIDQYPVNALALIGEALDRGVRLRFIEPEEGVQGPHIDLQRQEEISGLRRARTTPLVEQRVLESIDVLLILSEKGCALAFPTSDGEFDYKGFLAEGEHSLRWCRDLFQQYWEAAKPRVYISPTEYIQPRPMRAPEEITGGQVVVEGRSDSSLDVQAVQDAVDNFDEVILRGTFNFGSSSVLISRSVVIRGEGRVKDIPTTTISKKGWGFPFREWDSILLVDGKGVDVTIENLQFTDFNCTSIRGWRGNSLYIRNNRITLSTGYGRGITYGAFGDFVHGILVESADEASFMGGVVIEGNYIDFASGGIWGGHVSRSGLEDDPEYRPDLFNHEYYVGFGIAVNGMRGTVRIENNIVRNVNGRGIATSAHEASADVRIRHNTIVSDVYGAYPFSSHEAGAGILAQSALDSPTPGFRLEIEENTIKLGKLNYSGIVVLGPATDREGADKLRDGSIRNNRIQLKNGYEGIHVRKCDDFEVADNTISGDAYYGIRISGRKRSGELDLRALNNIVEGNDMDDLRIREPDEYSNNHADGRMFVGAPEGSATTYVWLGKYSKNNLVSIGKSENVIDEGEDNAISYTEVS